ncbi:hypothetical protein [Aridibaculum aurantiacum]|uniref:hypothetical protein n=1 Tax=Aridibaculum aurantiacum TaxID=2810307 RepID=UPI001A96E3A4|nr:hypothetical protein [Aridibaculum aurantiacum]
MDKANDHNEATGHKQSDFAGTNPDKYGQPEMPGDQPINFEEEAQNVTDGPRTLSGEEAEQAANKANQNKED